jgi:hypothetical protein
MMIILASTGTTLRSRNTSSRFTTRDGETFFIHLADILAATDSSGSGHKRRLIDDAPRWGCYAQTGCGGSVRAESTSDFGWGHASRRLGGGPGPA